MKPSFALILCTIVCGAAPLGLAAQAGTMASSGVYTDAQAKQGAALYQAKCTTCHGDDLSGGGTAPALAGPDFVSNWGGKPLAALFNTIHSSMPSDQPGTLTPQQVANVLAFLLRSNRFPVGKAELPASADALQHITMDATPPDPGN